MSNHDQAGTPFPWLNPVDEQFDQVLDRMLAEAAAQIPGLSPDEKLVDPVVRLVFKAVAREYVRMYGKLHEVVDAAHEQLTASILCFPRAPRPASVVLQLEVKDSGTVVDENLIVEGRDAVPGVNGGKERNFHFVPFDRQVVTGITPPVQLVQAPDGLVRRAAAAGGDAGQWRVPGDQATWLHVGLDLPADCGQPRLPLFIQADDGDVSALAWSTWQVGPAEDPQTCIPAWDQRQAAWDGREEPPLLRSRSDTRRPDSPFDQAFVHLPLDFVRHGQGQPPAAVTAGIADGRLPAAPDRCWVSIRCVDTLVADRLGDLRIRPDCVVAFNLEARKFLCNAGQAPAEIVDLKLPYEDIFRIDEVRDAANVLQYVDAESSARLGAENLYHLDRDPDGNTRLRLLAARPAQRRRAIEVMYQTTLGAGANGLDVGSINTIYDNKLSPGVATVQNVTSTDGGGTGNLRSWLTSELRAQLASRGRAVTRQDFEVLTRAYDPFRIADVEVGRGVMRGPHGVVSCVRVVARCVEGAFHSDLEQHHFGEELRTYLDARAPADSQVLVEIVAN